MSPYEQFTKGGGKKFKNYMFIKVYVHTFIYATGIC